MDNAWRVKDVLSWLNINSEDDRYVSDLFINAEKCIKNSIFLAYFKIVFIDYNYLYFLYILILLFCIQNVFIRIFY